MPVSDNLPHAFKLLESLQENLQQQKLLLEEGASFDLWNDAEEKKKPLVAELEKIFPPDFPLNGENSARFSGHSADDLLKFKSLARSVNDLNNTVGQLIQLKLRQTQAAINVLRSSAARTEAAAEYGQDRRITGARSTRRLLMSG